MGKFQQLNVTETGIPKGEERQETKRTFAEIMFKHFSNLIKTINPEIQEAQQNPAHET